MKKATKMKAKDLLYFIVSYSAVILLTVLLVKQCGKPPKVETVTVMKYQPINLDSLKATIEPVIVEVPGPARQVVRYVPVTITDAAQADSLMQVYAELAKKYAALQDELGWAWDAGDGAPIEWGQDETVYSDSITTQDYFHRWTIRAQGPITGYEFGIKAFGQPIPFVEPVQPKLHRAGLFAGAQTMPGGLRPIVGASYGFGVLKVQAGFLPSIAGEKAQGMVLTGIEIPFR